MKIALAHPHSWPDVRRGGERYLHDLAWYLHAAGNEVKILTRSGAPRHDMIDGVPVHRTWPQAPPWLARLRALSDQVDGRRLAPALGAVDVVHALWPSAVTAARRAGIPVVFTILGAPYPAYRRQHPTAWRSLRRAARAADVVTAVGDEAAAAAADDFGVRVEPLPPGLRPGVFTPDAGPDPATEAREVLFASATDVRNKGFVHLLRAMTEVRRHHPDVRLLVAGPGDHLAAFHELPAAQRRDLLDATTRIPDDEAGSTLPRLYRRATLTVLPSRHEAFGLVLAESLACGTPVVGSDRGGPAEVIGDDERVGRRAPFGDAVALARAITDVLELAERPETTLACASRARRWDWTSHVGPQHETLYRTITNTRSSTWV